MLTKKRKELINKIVQIAFAIFTLYVIILFCNEPNWGLVIAYGIILFLFLIRNKIIAIDLLLPTFISSVLYIPIGMIIISVATGQSPDPIVYLYIPFTVLPIVFGCAYLYNLLVSKFFHISLATVYVKQLVIGIIISALSFLIYTWFEYANDLNYNPELGYINHLKIQPKIIEQYLTMFLLQVLAFISINYFYNRFKLKNNES